MLLSFSKLLDGIKDADQKTVVVAQAEDKDILIALEKARSLGLSNAILTGKVSILKKILKDLKIDEKNYQLIQAGDETTAVNRAVQLIRENQAQVLMKGLCSSAGFLKGILDKENGIRSGKLLSHLALFESPNYHKLLLMSDAAINIHPDLNQKIGITENAILVAKKLGYTHPKVAILSAIEKVNADAIPSSGDAAIIAKMAERGQIKDAIVDGPLAVDNALSLKSCEVKGLLTPVGGDTDICIVPNIETGNVFYKLLTVLGKAKVAGIIVGALAPVVLTSRADSEESKFLSLVTALKAS